MAMIENQKDLREACAKPYENWSGLKQYLKERVHDKDSAIETAKTLKYYGMKPEIIVELFKSCDLDNWNDIYPV